MRLARIAVRTARTIGISAVLVGVGSGQVTLRVGVATDGSEADAECYVSGMSPDGRYVAFDSRASDLVPGDTNGVFDGFVRDVRNGTTELVSLGVGGALGNGHSGLTSMSSDARWIAFVSEATNLVPGDTNGDGDVFLRDRIAGTTRRVSVSSSGLQGNEGSELPAISADGRFVGFTSNASNLVPGDTNGDEDCFVHDRVTGTTSRVNVDSSGAQSISFGFYVYPPSISADGRFVAFSTRANDLVSPDANGGIEDVFVRDRLAGTTVLVSVSTGGAQGNMHSFAPRISADGRFVTFLSASDGLVAGDTNGTFDVFVRDRLAGTTERASVGSNGEQGDVYCDVPSISADGRFVGFLTASSGLVAGDANGISDVFLRDRFLGTTERVNLSSGNVEANATSQFYAPAMSADGRRVAFSSWADNLVNGDTNGVLDVFVRDRAASGFTSFCDPGVGGVIACPCGNPPIGPGRGCDNSVHSGGAWLAASGVAYLSMDTLTFSTRGQRPGALSIVLQGNAANSAGVAFGQGVRCVAGSLERLYTKIASGGGIVAPDLAAGEPPVSARSAALGDPIQVGESRWYFVAYRDPIVGGSCPPTSTVNATQSGRVEWSP